MQSIIHIYMNIFGKYENIKEILSAICYVKIELTTRMEDTEKLMMNLH